MSKNVLITGAAGNLGKAVVKKFIAAGYTVIATVSPGKDLGYSVTGNVDVYQADLTDEVGVATMFTSVMRKYETIESALFLAGGYAPGNIQSSEMAAVKKMITMNFETAYVTARLVFNQMTSQAGGGRIILVGARPVLKPMDGKGSLAYTLSKSLIFQLAELLNAEGLKKNVVASVIVPSTIDTPTNRSAMPDADFTKWVNPDDIADAMLYLCSDAAKPLSNPVLKMYGQA